MLQRCTRRTSKFQEALLDYQGILNNFPEGQGLDEVRFSVAMMAVKLKKFEPARRSLMAIIEKNPETPIADKVLYQLANIFFMEGSSKEAIEVLRVASDKYKDSPLYTEMLFTMANAYEELGQSENAIKVYKTIRYSYPTRTSSKRSWKNWPIDSKRPRCSSKRRCRPPSLPISKPRLAPRSSHNPAPNRVSPNPVLGKEEREVLG
jgi:tetratricopeptide (TPR) repeat protein